MMIEKKYVVPEGMLKVFGEAYDHQKGLGANREGCEKAGMETALQWLAENPIVPTTQQAAGMAEDCGNEIRKPNRNWSAHDCVTFYAVAWQRRMFLAPEPEYGFIECDTCRAKSGSPTLCRGCLHNREVIEAFRRGTEAAK